MLLIPNRGGELWNHDGVWRAQILHIIVQPGPSSVQVLTGIPLSWQPFLRQIVGLRCEQLAW